MLVLKLLLVPCFLLLVSLVGEYWGAALAGWLAGLPVVAGPILYLLAVEHGVAFAAAAASSSLSAVLASLSFGVAYSRCSLSFRWPVALLAGLCAWLASASLLAIAPTSVVASAVFALAALFVAPYLFPPIQEQSGGHAVGRAELALRMAAGAALTVGVTLCAGRVGAKWSGLLAVFPVISSVLAVFSHRAQGPMFSAVLLRAMARGLFSFAAFCLLLAATLRTLGVPVAFVLSIGGSFAVQCITRRNLTPPSSGRL